jgi:hypothetical protein
MQFNQLERFMDKAYNITLGVWFASVIVDFVAFGYADKVSHSNKSSAYLVLSLCYMFTAAIMTLFLNYAFFDGCSFLIAMFNFQRLEFNKHWRNVLVTLLVYSSIIFYTLLFCALFGASLMAVSSD